MGSNKHQKERPRGGPLPDHLGETFWKEMAFPVTLQSKLTTKCAWGRATQDVLSRLPAAQSLPMGLVIPSVYPHEEKSVCLYACFTLPQVLGLLLGGLGYCFAHQNGTPNKHICPTRQLFRTRSMLLGQNPMNVNAGISHLPTGGFGPSVGR